MSEVYRVAFIGTGGISRAHARYYAANPRTRIVAAWEGGADVRVVGERLVDPGAMLKANDPICSILEITELTGVIFVSERDYPKLTVGQAVVVTADAYPGRTFPGTVSRIAPVIRESTREARVEVSIQNTDLSLKPGMFIRAGIELARHDAVPAVPSNAISRRSGKQGVFVVPDGQRIARFVPVITGITSGELVEIAGPAPEGRIVTLGHHLLSDGQQVMLPGDTPPPAASPGKPSAGGPRGAGR